MAVPSRLLKGAFLEEVKFKKNVEEYRAWKGPSGSGKGWFGAFGIGRREVQGAIFILTRQAGE